MELRRLDACDHTRQPFNLSNLCVLQSCFCWYSALSALTMARPDTSEFTTSPAERRRHALIRQVPDPQLAARHSLCDGHETTDIARSFRPNTLSVRWAPARQCGVRFLLEYLETVHEKCGNCRGRSSSLDEIMQIVTSAVCIFVAVHCSVARTTFFSGLMRLRSFSCSTSSIVTNRSRDSSVESVRLKI